MVWCGPMWRPHGNRVSKTRFTTLINIEKNPEHIREEPKEEEKKRKKTETKREEPRTSEKPRQRARSRATQAAQGLGRLLIVQWLTHITSGWWSGIRSVQHGSESLDSFSLWFDCCVSGFLKFFFFCVFRLVRDLINRALEARFPGRKKLPHWTTSDHENRVSKTRFIGQNRVF